MKMLNGRKKERKKESAHQRLFICFGIENTFISLEKCLGFFFILRTVKVFAFKS